MRRQNRRRSIEYYFRGKANIKLHTMLTVLAYQARQITRLRGVVVVDKAS